jgi:TonB family protein
MNRSTAALLIALLLHFLIIALFVILGMVAPVPEPPEKPKEHRVRVSLKEYPKARKDALVKNRLKQPAVAPPMPRGEQLEQLPSATFETVPPAPHEVPRPVVKPLQPPKPVKKQEKLPDVTKHIPIPKKPLKPVLPDIAPTTPKTVPLKREAEKREKEDSSRLYSKLMTPTLSTAPATETPKLSKERQSRINSTIRETYGDTFALLSAGEQKYILDNQEIMRRITQEVLNRVASVSIPRELRVDDYNLVEFYLYPNGDISDIKLLRRSGFYKLDDTTVETIQYAYSRYPRPKQKTLIRYKFGYYLRGY